MGVGGGKGERQRGEGERGENMEGYNTHCQ